MELSLNENWQLHEIGHEFINATIPGSVYSNLINSGEMESPYFRENEIKDVNYSNKEYEFVCHFNVNNEILSYDEILLRLEEIDTIADVYLNGQLLDHVENMHRVYDYDIKSILNNSCNTLIFHFYSPLKYIAEKQKKDPLFSASPTLPGFPHLRKAHYMFGWDWGPVVADIGIYILPKIICSNFGKIDHVFFNQEHHSDFVSVKGNIITKSFKNEPQSLKITVFDPEENLIASVVMECQKDKTKYDFKVDIESPELWWPNGYGNQPLYRVLIQLCTDTLILDERSYKIGLRTITVSQEKDKWGAEFCLMVNRTKIFTMGADYVPEDNIIPYCNEERTRSLLKKCKYANFNCIRVWGGGYYPRDYFFNLCDEMGLIIWEDFMYACGVYRMTNDFSEQVRLEAIDNLKRFAHHASLGVLCGNNEMEQAWIDWGIPQIEELKEDYLLQFENILSSVCHEFAPATFYWPSSPSSGGGFHDPNSKDMGDTHYWEVWHGMRPKEDFFKYYFRFCSEYGFESLPSMKTICAFTEKQDRNLFSPVMELHQKCEEGNKKLLYYISESTPYPKNMEQLVYATQLIQAEAIGANVEHMRRNRGRCMGSIYWQLNDSNPVISWSGIDYYGREKALHYYAKHFYSPVLLSINQFDEHKILFNISNETVSLFEGEICYSVRDSLSNIIEKDSRKVSVNCLSSFDVFFIDISQYWNNDYNKKREIYLSYELLDKTGRLSQSSCIFVPLKHFAFQNPEIKIQIKEDKEFYIIIITSKAYAKNVYLDFTNMDCTFSDNWFDLNAFEEKEITINKAECEISYSIEQLYNQLSIISAYSLMNID